MLIAVEGCCHGELEAIYKSLGALERHLGVKVELLLICGDFQSVRNRNDLESLACPPKYRKMGDFERYFRGEVEAPVLTIFIGGNHEASNYLWENYYGGWVAKNIYFLGYSGVIEVNGLVIAGMSGIYKPQDVHRGYTERPPYDPGTQRSIYHVRDFEAAKFEAYAGRRPDIVLTHDWPRGVYNHGDKQGLVRWKKQFADEIARNELGSPIAERLLQRLRPPYFFSGHLHCKFSAVVDWAKDPVSPAPLQTKFLALDKCLPGRGYMQVLDIEGTAEPGWEPGVIYRPVSWLAVLKASNGYFPAMRAECRMAPHAASLAKEVSRQEAALRHRLETTRVPVTPWNPEWASDDVLLRWLDTDHPQTAALCTLLAVDNHIKRPESCRDFASKRLPGQPASVAETRSQLGSIQGGVTDANRLLEDLLGGEGEPATAVPPPPPPPPPPQPVSHKDKPDEGDDDLFQVFVDAA